MKIVIAGCRHYQNYPQAKQFIDECIGAMRNHNTLIILSGQCKGADLLGERYACEHGLAIEHFPADWKKYGKGAGPKRNQEMAKQADCVICFWDGKSKGTKSMIAYAKQFQKTVFIKYVDNSDCPAI